ncbi:MAG: adenine phosphoribosyltransferase [Oscillospiraceae bacterium]|nr:adenine phosphoribosyltransferase [Oscillospiraceae bacterium]
MDLKGMIRHVRDFPRPGIDFLDITPVLLDGEAFRYVTDSFVKELRGVEFDIVASLEARGFILGASVAYALNKGFVPIRKKNKLPWKTVSVSYELEYGSDVFEMHADSVKPGQKIVIIDDLLATGGTLEASVKLIETLGGEVVGSVFFIELEDLRGREKFSGANFDIFSLIKS